MPVKIQIGTTLPETGGHVVTTTLICDIAPDVGSMLIRALAEQGKLIELQELTERLQRIEKQLKLRQ